MATSTGRVIAVVNTKGGAGKTTTSVLLALALSAHGSVELRDADPQGSATEWAERAEDANTPLPFDVVVANQRTLKHKVRSDWSIIDTPPGDAGIIDAAIAVADFVIIPSTPTGLDIDRMWATLEVAQRTPHAVLLTRVGTGTNTLAAALALLDEEKVPRFETLIPRREAIAASFGAIPHNLHGYENVAAELMEVVA
jgi:virC1 protein